MAPVLRYTSQLESIGEPVDRLLVRSRIPTHLLKHPTAVIPLENVFRFLELACRTLGTEYLGLHVGFATPLGELGPYGRTLQNSLTIYDYLCRGISLYRMLMTGQHFWLSEHGEEFRLNIATIGKPRIGAYQSHIETLVTTIENFRKAAGANWSPREISLAYMSQEDLPDIEPLANSRVLRGTGETYLTIPRALMALRFPCVHDDIPKKSPNSSTERLLPEDLSSLVQIQLESLLSDRVFQIDIVAETLNMNRHKLQRSLAKQGLNYSLLLAETRMRRAADWLEKTDKPITELAFELGYTDASNFTRAFRRQIGVSPQTFRDGTIGT
ncbi:MAG: AraC family transcriptional regulator ligand-binding domain-containing protein [Candidatus Competibacteraceae bacterium]|nr:AraC family transcriptional regulator ligand-binding domain-containing protein [Candidatus Competibacteraceae bacterium]